MKNTNGRYLIEPLGLSYEDLAQAAVVATKSVNRGSKILDRATGKYVTSTAIRNVLRLPSTPDVRPHGPNLGFNFEGTTLMPDFTLLKGLLPEDEGKKVVESQEFEEDVPAAPENDGIVRVAFSRYDEFLAALDKVNKKAAKYNVPPLTVVSKEKVNAGKFKDGSPRLEWHIKMEAHPIRIGGWDFLASVEHSGGKQNVIRFVPGREADSRVRDYANASNRNCDFCQSSRDRNNTYLIKNIVNGELRQVGGQCLQKYIGDEARKLAKFAFSMEDLVMDMIEDDGEGGSEGGGRRVREAYDVETVLSIAVAAIKQFGFVRATNNEDDGRPPTSRIVRLAIGGRYDRRDVTDEEYAWLKGIRDEGVPETFKHEANQIIEWFNALPDDQKNSEYMLSLESIINADMVTSRSVGIVVSLPAVYFRHHNEIKQREQAKPSNWVGTENAKIPETEVEVVYTNIMDGNYGAYQIVKMVDEAGNHYTWFNTGANRLETGAKIKIIGTVKKHDEYKGVKNTVLIRVKAKPV